MPTQHELRSFASSLVSSHVRERAGEVLVPVLEHAEKLQLDFATIAERCAVSSFKLAMWKSGELKPNQSEAQKIIECICHLALEEQAKL